MLDVVQNAGAHVDPVHMEAAVHDLAQILFDNFLVDFQLEHILQALPGLEAQVLGDGGVEDEAAQGAVNEPALGFAFKGAGDAHLDRRMQGYFMGLVGHLRLIHGGEDAPGALGGFVF